MYEQIKDGIRKEILEGRLEENQLLPSVRQLSTELNVSTITTKRAYSDLEREGLIYTVSGKGTFVNLKSIDEIKDKRRSELCREFREFCEKMVSSGIEKSELIKIIGEAFDSR